MTEVWFIRHGESESNAGEVIQSRSSSNLTKLGREQASALETVFDKAPDLIVMSSYIRAQQTAEPIKALYPTVSCEVWPIHEFCHLKDEGYKNTSKYDRRPKIHEYWDRMDPEYIDGEGAESFSQTVERITNSFERLQKRPEKFIAVFTHGFIMHIISVLLAKNNLEMNDLMIEAHRHSREEDIKNCSIIKVKATANDVSLLSVNHLG